ncbi:hypothetical protein BDV98DRAFT_557278 [Pterulicium gracile]|uniref:DUF6534 domain-containing protein n=1 Tax=Pterulicium gracile TaxID=1884261 RepID=A0A5C3QYT9_9AGAR|nr:hypothetical protein BDV98DRAFT_557278 [Pterula gracilis]
MADGTTPPICVFPLDIVTELAGPYLVGHLLSFGVFGVLCVQLYIYHIAFKSDPSWLKGIVWLLFAIEVTFQAIEFHMAYWTLGEGWGRLDRIFAFPKPTIAFTTLTGVATSIVHAFYAWRIIVLSKRYIVVVVVALLSATQLSMTIYISVYLSTHLTTDPAVVIKNTTDFITVWFVTAAAADIIITLAMLFLLVHARSESTHTRTISRVESLMKYTVETGLVTSCAAVITLILLLAKKDKVYYYIMYYSIGKIYANTLLATLNSRMTFITASNQLSSSQTALQLYSRSAMWKDMGSGQHSMDSSARINPNANTTALVFKDYHISSTLGGSTKYTDLSDGGTAV